MGLHGLKAKPSECQIFRRSVQYLGYVVYEKGIQVDFEKVRVVAQWPVPSCQQEKKDLHLIKGLFPTLHRLLPLCTTCVSRIELGHGMLNVKEHLVPLNMQLLTSAPILIFRHFDHPFILDVDVSATGLCAILSQVIDGHERAVAYTSRALTKPERRYCTTRQEMLVLVWAAQHFRAYLYERSFQARTDHQSLKWLRNFKEPEGQVARWLEALAEYDLEVVHLVGSI